MTSEDQNQEQAFKESKKEFLSEFRRMQKSCHRLLDHLTAISGYAQIAQCKKERSGAELHKIIDAMERSTAMLRVWIANLKEVGTETLMTQEESRLEQSRDRVSQWKRWGPYVKSHGAGRMVAAT